MDLRRAAALAVLLVSSWGGVLACSGSSTPETPAGPQDGGGPEGSVLDGGAVGEGGGPSLPDVAELTVAAFHQGLAAGTLTAASVTSAYLARIDAYDRRGPNLRAVITVNGDVVREAKALDDDYKTTHTLRGPLHGVPVLVKDSIDVAGLPTTGGTTVFRASVPAKDSAAVARLRAAGALVIGKANLDELQIGAFGLSTLGGQALTPYDLERVAGGSSAGVGAGLAAGFALLGLGADTNGSIRTPASFCNLAGLRPTVGLVSAEGSMPGTPVEDTLGPMARTVTDLALALDALADRSAGSDGGTGSFTASLTAQGLVGTRLGYVRALNTVTDATSSDDRDVLRVMARDLDELRAAGADVVAVDLPQSLLDAIDATKAKSEAIGDVAAPWATYLAGTSGSGIQTFADLAARRGELYAQHPPILQISSRGAIGAKADAVYSATAKADYLALQQDLRAKLAAFLDAPPGGGGPLQALVLHQGKAFRIAPGTALGYETPPPAPAGSFAPDLVMTFLSTSGALPTLVVPGGFTSDRIPVGIHFLGRPFAEATLLRLGFAFEARTRARKSPALP